MARNRLADLSAKEFAAAISPVPSLRSPRAFNVRRISVACAMWLSQLRELLPTNNENQVAEDDDTEEDLSLEP